MRGYFRWGHMGGEVVRRGGVRNGFPQAILFSTSAFSEQSCDGMLIFVCRGEG